MTGIQGSELPRAIFLRTRPTRAKAFARAQVYPLEHGSGRRILPSIQTKAFREAHRQSQPMPALASRLWIGAALARSLRVTTGALITDQFHALSQNSK